MTNNFDINKLKKILTYDQELYIKNVIKDILPNLEKNEFEILIKYNYYLLNYIAIKFNINNN